VITISAAILCLTLAQKPAPTILGREFLPTLGLVTLSTEGSRVDVRMDKDGAKREESFDISGLVPHGRITEARCGSWLGEEIAIVLAIREGETTRYRLALSVFGRQRVPDFGGIDGSHYLDPSQLWFLTDPVFESTGEPFRIVAVNDHTNASDAFEITFRRGWLSRIEDSAKLEEKVLFNSCGGYYADVRKYSVFLERGGSPR